VRIILWLTIFLATAASHLSAEPPSLKVGMELSYPPFEMTDTQGKPTGVSVDLALALGSHLGQPVQIENMGFDGLIPALKSKKIDVIISSLTVTPERAKSVDFSTPYLTTGLALLLPHRSTVHAVSELNQAGRTVAVKKGTTGHLYARQNLPSAKLLVLDKESSAVLEVVQGKADAFIYDQLSIYRHWREHEAATRPLLTAFQTEGWAVAVRKRESALLNKIEIFLTNFRAQGGFDQLAQRYLAAEKEAFSKLGIPFVF
jgi:polar amino acid transport system substrate-binding protein